MSFYENFWVTQFAISLTALFFISNSSAPIKFIECGIPLIASLAVADFFVFLFEDDFKRIYDKLNGL